MLVALKRRHCMLMCVIVCRTHTHTKHQPEAHAPTLAWAHPYENRTMIIARWRRILINFINFGNSFYLILFLYFLWFHSIRFFSLSNRKLINKFTNVRPIRFEHQIMLLILLACLLSFYDKILFITYDETACTHTHTGHMNSAVSFDMVLHSNKVNCYDYIILSNKIENGLKR